MNAPELAEARATAEVLRATAKAVRGQKGSLHYRLLRAAEALDNVVALALRLLNRVEWLEQQLKGRGQGGVS